MTKDTLIAIETILKILQTKKVSQEEYMTMYLILLENEMIPKTSLKQLLEMEESKLESMPKEELMNMIKGVRGKIVKEKRYPWDK